MADISSSSALAPADWSALPSRRDLIERIERLAVPADAKALLGQLATVTAQVGGKLVEIGRRILAFVFEMVKTFPNTLFGLLTAHVVTVLIASAPLLGALLGPMLAPLLAAFAIGMGAVADMQGGNLRAHVDALVAEFRAIFA
jgi:hypothetical protein